MKLILITILSLLSVSVVMTEDTTEISSNGDELDVTKLATDDTQTESMESQRKRDSSYVYARPDRLATTRYETGGIRGRIVTRYPSFQTSRPFTKYGPPKVQARPQFAKPNDQYAPQHSYVSPHRQQQQQQQHRRPYPQQNGFGSNAGQFNKGQMDQDVPSPIRNNDFVGPSPIASQNNEPFNSNAANYLPPRNQKLPGYSHSNQFANDQQSGVISMGEQFLTNDNQQQQQHLQQQNQQQHQQNTNVQHQQFQSFVQSPFQDNQQISDAAIFLSQNAQAISQLYEAPATNLNYEPIHESSGSSDPIQNPNNQFQTFDVNDLASQRLQATASLHGNLPSYASGFLDADQTVDRVNSQRKDRLIAQLQRALAQTTGDSSNPTSSRYVEDHQSGSFVNDQSALSAFGRQLDSSRGSQLDNSNVFDGTKLFGGGNRNFGQSGFLPDQRTTVNGLALTYGLPSTTPAATQSPATTTTIATSTTTLSANEPAEQGSNNDGGSQVGSSGNSPGTSLTYPLTSYGGFVPTNFGSNVLHGYPNYGTHFLGTNLPTQSPVQSAGSSPTHFGIPIPTLPAIGHDTPTSFGPTASTKPQTTAQGHNQRPSLTPVHGIPLQPIQPVNPIAATPVHPVYPVGPSVTHVHPIQNHVPVVAGHPAYGFQSAVINPVIVKPVKGVLPIYYYPNVYHQQKPAVGSLPWGYAPAYTQTKSQQIWK